MPNVLRQACKLVMKGDHQTRMAEVHSSILTEGNILLLVFFLFHLVKPLMPTLPIPSRFVKTSCVAI